MDKDDWTDDFRVMVNITEKNETNLPIVACDGKCNENEIELFEHNIAKANLGNRSTVHLNVTWLQNPNDDKKLNVCSIFTIKKANCHQPNSYRFHYDFGKGSTDGTQFKITYKGKFPLVRRLRFISVFNLATQ